MVRFPGRLFSSAMTWGAITGGRAGGWPGAVPGGAADVAELIELGAAGEPVGQDHGVWWGVADGGQQGGLGDGV